MQCYVYKSKRKINTYVYLCVRDDFSKLPPSIVQHLGQLELVLEFDLHAERKLAKENAALLLSNLETQGFHIQLPDANSLNIIH